MIHRIHRGYLGQDPTAIPQGGCRDGWMQRQGAHGSQLRTSGYLGGHDSYLSPHQPSNTKVTLVFSESSSLPACV